MDESELALILLEYLESGDVVIEELDETGATSFYATVAGKRFKVSVRECGEDA